jgi:hypothetical protein
MCKANRENLKFFIILLFCALLASVAGVLRGEEPSPLPNLSLTIREELQSLKQESVIMNVELQNTISLLAERSQDLKVSEQERQKSQTELTALYGSLTSMTRRYDDLASRMIVSNDRLERSQKMNRNLWIVLIAWTALKIVRIILGFIPQTRIINKIIPQWLDILI